MTKSSFGRYSALLAGVIAASLQTNAAIYYPDFSDVSGLQLNGDAAGLTPNADNVLRLTAQTGQSGSAFSTSSVELDGASFSTYFSFRLHSPSGIGDYDGQGADGIVFVVQTVSNTAGGEGGGIGYDGLPFSVGIEYDTYYNGFDPDGNHLGIDINGSVVSDVTSFVSPAFNDGNIWYSWVDYDGSILEVRVSQIDSRPALANLSYAVDLEDVLGTSDAFVGFTSGTGAGANYHDILEWQFIPEYDPIDNPVPEPATVIGGFGLAALIGARTLRRARKS